MLKSSLLTVVISLFSTVCLALPSEVEKDLQRYIETFQHQSKNSQIEIAKRLEWEGLSQVELFDLIEDKLLADYQTASTKEDIEYLSWMSKALGFSGNEKYRDTLQAVAQKGSHRKLKSHAARSLKALDQYRSWNNIFIDEKHWNPEESADLNRYRAMMRSNVLELKRFAAKRVFYTKDYNESLLDTFDQQLKENMTSNRNDKLFVDTWAWIAKALASSSNSKYLPTIKEMADNAPNAKLRKYGVKYLRQYQ